jgi:hypothetical protein
MDHLAVDCAELRFDDENRREPTFDQDRFRDALEALPSLTRAVLLLSSRHRLSYDEIGWVCGISIDDVCVRMSDALLGISSYLDDCPRPLALLRRSVLPYRCMWAAARKREQDRVLAPYLSPDGRPEKRKLIDWIVWVFERVAR